MLSEERRQQISAEEVFRNEVRRSLEAKPTPQSGGAHTWTLLNSSFPLSVLSTLVVGTITGLYTRYETRTAEEVRKQESVESEAARRRELVRDLDIEIGNRIAYATLRLEEWKEEITRRKTQYTER